MDWTSSDDLVLFYFTAKTREENSVSFIVSVSGPSSECLSNSLKLSSKTEEAGEQFQGANGPRGAVSHMPEVTGYLNVLNVTWQQRTF